MLRFTGQEAPFEHDLARITLRCFRLVQGEAPAGATLVDGPYNLRMGPSEENFELSVG
jgi:hypothetical protein